MYFYLDVKIALQHVVEIRSYLQIAGSALYERDV